MKQIPLRVCFCLSAACVEKTCNDESVQEKQEHASKIPVSWNDIGCDKENQLREIVVVLHDVVQMAIVLPM